MGQIYLREISCPETDLKWAMFRIQYNLVQAFEFRKIALRFVAVIWGVTQQVCCMGIQISAAKLEVTNYSSVV